jgi:hypothetical protein
LDAETDMSVEEEEDEIIPRTARIYTYAAKLPSQCPTKCCPGVLSVAHTSRFFQFLLEMSDCPFRWVVSCPECSTTWHACHFGCGHLRKRTKTGSSDISRHEKGRVGKHQRGVRAGCRLNPNEPKRLRDLAASQTASHTTSQTAVSQTAVSQTTSQAAVNEAAVSLTTLSQVAVSQIEVSQPASSATTILTTATRDDCSQVLQLFGISVPK